MRTRWGARALLRAAGPRGDPLQGREPSAASLCAVPSALTGRGRLWGRGEGEPTAGSDETAKLALDDTAARSGACYSVGTHRALLRQPAQSPSLAARGGSSFASLARCSPSQARTRFTADRSRRCTRSIQTRPPPEGDRLRAKKEERRRGQRAARASATRSTRDAPRGLTELFAAAAASARRRCDGCGRAGPLKAPATSRCCAGAGGTSGSSRCARRCGSCGGRRGESVEFDGVREDESVLEREGGGGRRRGGGRTARRQCGSP